MHLKGDTEPVGAGVPANQATRCLAAASPVFAGTPAPTGSVPAFGCSAGSRAAPAPAFAVSGSHSASYSADLLPGSRHAFTAPHHPGPAACRLRRWRIVAPAGRAPA
ncbi:hypothetical protein D0O09_25895 [Pseudomonas putida]|nr:hypothetical protein D0O09_25895 [Pseudomonas putida]